MICILFPVPGAMGGWDELCLPVRPLTVLVTHHARFLLSTSVPTWLLRHTVGRLLRRLERLS